MANLITKQPTSEYSTVDDGIKNPVGVTGLRYLTVLRDYAIPSLQEHDMEIIIHIYAEWCIFRY